MKTDGTGVLDMKHGDMKHVENMTFGADDASLTLMIQDTGGVNGAPMIHNAGGAVDLEGILFNDNDVTLVSNVSFNAGGTIDLNNGTFSNLQTLNMTSEGTLNMNDSTMHEVKVLNMKTDGTGVLDMKHGDMKHVENMTFGADDASLTLMIQDTGGVNGAPMIHNAGGAVDLQGILFNENDVTLVSNVTFTVGGASVLDMSEGNIDNVNVLNMKTDGTGVIDMIQGNIINIKNMTMAPTSVSDFADGLVKNVQTMTLTQDTGEINLNGGTLLMGGGNIDMDDGSIINVTDLTVGDIRLHDTNKINNNGTSNSVVLEGVDFKDQDITLIKNATFTVGGASVLDMSEGNIDNVNVLTMKTDGTGVLDMKHGDMKHVENMTFGADDASLTLMIQDTGGVNGAPMIHNAGGAVDLEGILFNDKNVTLVSNMSFNTGGTIDLNNGTFSNLHTLHMTPQGTLHMTQSDMLDLKNMTMTNNLTVGTMVLGPSATIQHNNGGFVTLEGVEVTDRKMSKLTELTFTTGGSATMSLSDGSVSDVLTQTMTNQGTLNMSAGTIDFGNIAGALEMTGVSAEINIGQMNMKSNMLTNATLGGIVKVEDTEFNDAEVRTTYIKKLDSQVQVEETVFVDNGLTVTNVFTDNVLAKTTNGPVTIKGSTVNLSSAATTDAIRITNVATPIDDFDAANKKYVNEAVQENVQGLRPRKATDCSLSGGMEGGSASDFDKASGSAFGNFTSYAIEFVKNNPDAEGNDMCELKFHLEDSVGDKMVTFDGVAFDTSELATITESGTELTGPAIPKKRVLIMHLDENSINGAASYYTGTNFTNKLVHDASDLKGLNGIWEIETFEDATGVTGWKTLTMTRSLDMNESDEVLNGAYTYVKNGTTRANYGYVVTSKDPIKLGVDASPTDVRGLTIDGSTGELMQLEWIEFNNIDFELAFVNEQGTKKELLSNVTTTFKKGGLAMKFDPTDEKQVMVNAELLRYETGVGLDGLSNGEGLSLQINGDIDFNLSNVDSHINSFGDETKVIVNNTIFERQGANANIYTTNITANTITAESDRNLKKNIASMQNGLGMVSKLRSVNYQWKDENKSQLVEYGFIAQEVEENFPSLVQTNPNTGIKSVDYPKMVSILALAVQELTAKVDALTANK